MLVIKKKIWFGFDDKKDFFVFDKTKKVS